MEIAAACATMPWCINARISRSGRYTSIPIIRTISNTCTLIAPSTTRYTPSAKVAAAPTAMPVSVIPRDREFVASTHKVLWKSTRAFSSSSFVRAALWPKDFNVPRPCMESRNSDANALYAFERAKLFALSHL